MSQAHWNESHYLLELSAKKLQSLLTALLETQLKTPHSAYGVLILADQIQELDTSLGQLCDTPNLSPEEKAALEQLSDCLTTIKSAYNRFPVMEPNTLPISEQLQFLQEELQETNHFLDCLKTLPSSRLTLLS